MLNVSRDVLLNFNEFSDYVQVILFTYEKESKRLSMLPMSRPTILISKYLTDDGLQLAFKCTGCVKSGEWEWSRVIFIPQELINKTPQHHHV